MLLKSLILKGFKSFADSTVLTLEPGVTIVVGPNGSGKSNVVDAVAWVLGAQAPKSVRSQRMDDVIFAGTATRPALGRAEVSITIDNSDGILGVEFNEVTITRILFRTGESEYEINGVPCRLLDIQKLLSDAGVGRQQHVIVGQGQIDGVLNARPEERRAIIEDAASVLHFRKRKEKAERRLDVTEDNLRRVQDLLSEVRRRLRPLERQAQAAERYGEMLDELATLKTFIAGRELVGLRARLEAVVAVKLESASRESECASMLAMVDASIVTLESELGASGISVVAERLRHVEQLRERGRGLNAVLAERRRSLEREKGQLMDADVVANLESEVAALRTELIHVAEELETVESADVTLAVEEAALVAERSQMLDAVGIHDGSTKAASAAAEVRGELRSVRAVVERAEDKLRRAQGRHESLQERLRLVDERLGRFRVECEKADEIEGPLFDRFIAAEEDLAAAEVDVEAARTACSTAADVAMTAAARVDALRVAVTASSSSAGTESLHIVDGVLGTLLNLIEIDDGWQLSVEAALGESLTAAIVADPESGRRALEALRSSQTGGAVLALNRPWPPIEPPPVGDPVRPHVRSPNADVERLLSGLLASAVQVASVSDALDVVNDHPDARVVTAEGDRFDRSAWRIGAAVTGVTAAALDDAIVKAATADAELISATGSLAAAEAGLSIAQRAEVDISRQLDENDARLSTATEGLSPLQAERREIQAELVALEHEIVDDTGNVERATKRLNELEALLPTLESDEQTEVEASRARSERRVEFQARSAVLASQRQDLEVRNAELHQRRDLLERRIEEIERRLKADRDARSSAEGRRAQIERSLDAIDRLVTLVGDHRTVVEEHHDELAKELRRRNDEVCSLNENLGQLRRKHAEVKRSLETDHARVHKAELEEHEAKIRLDTAIQALRDDLEVEPSVAEAAEVPDLPEGATPAGRVRELQRELNLLGPINPLALEEFNELQQRHRFLEKQMGDVRSTRRELTRVIAAVDAEIQNLFHAAFTDVSQNFSELFGLLFPGGSGKLLLTHPDDMLNTGIEVEAKPSGKNIKKLSLLSGGERSLTALAYLFSVFRSRPSPFYVLDEVEAALDDVNLQRFLGLITEFRKHAQLIIVSHQKRTMEAGDVLCGVSMQPGGSSKVVTAKAGTDRARSEAAVVSTCL